MKEHVLHAKKSWREIKGWGRKAVKFYFFCFVFATFPTPPFARFSVFVVLLTTNLTVGGERKKERKEKWVKTKEFRPLTKCDTIYSPGPDFLLLFIFFFILFFLKISIQKKTKKNTSLAPSRAHENYTDQATNLVNSSPPPNPWSQRSHTSRLTLAWLRQDFVIVIRGQTTAILVVIG